MGLLPTFMIALLVANLHKSHSRPAVATQSRVFPSSSKNQVGADTRSVSHAPGPVPFRGINEEYSSEQRWKTNPGVKMSTMKTNVEKQSYGGVSQLYQLLGEEEEEGDDLVSGDAFFDTFEEPGARLMYGSYGSSGGLVYSVVPQSHQNNYYMPAVAAMPMIKQVLTPVVQVPHAVALIQSQPAAMQPVVIGQQQQQMQQFPQQVQPEPSVTPGGRSSFPTGNTPAITPQAPAVPQPVQPVPQISPAPVQASAAASQLQPAQITINQQPQPQKIHIILTEQPFRKKKFAGYYGY